MTAHTCHAIRCGKTVPPKLLMCARHWRMVPRALQNEIWATYRPGQERDKKPSAAYLEVQQRVVRFVAEREGVWAGSLDQRAADAASQFQNEAPR